MVSPSDVLNQLRVKMFTNQLMKNIEIDDSGGDNVDEGFLDNFMQQYPDPDLDKSMDVPLSNKDIDSEDNYQTQVPVTIAPDNPPNKRIKLKFEQIFKEQNPDEEGYQAGPEEKATPAEEPVPSTPSPVPGETVPPEQTGMEPGAEMGMEPGMDTGMPPVQDTSKTPAEIGKIYELKKIYTRLTTIESYLAEVSNPDLLRLRLLVSKAIELFEILSSNLDSFKPPRSPETTINEIIIVYYKFLDQVYESVVDYYKKTKNDEDEKSIVFS